MQYYVQKAGMIENTMYIQQFLQSIEAQLCDIDQLNASEFVNNLLMYPLPGWEQKIIAMIRQAIFEFQSQRIIKKYLQIVDKLIKIPGFQNAVANSLVQIYCDIFYYLHLQKCHKELEDIKIWRKFWVGNVHPILLQQMKENILMKINIDLDHGIKAERVSKIKAHYANKLNMSGEDIQRQFPPKQSVEEAIYNQRYLVQSKPARQVQQQNHYYNGNHMYPSPPSYPQNYNVHSHPHGYLPYQSPVNSASMEPLSSYEHQLNEETKRKRFASEETRATGGTKCLEISQPKPGKVQHRDESSLDYRSMLSNLKAVNVFSCKECGMMFATVESQEEHKKQHFKEKLLRIEQGDRQIGMNLLGEKKWRGDSEEIINHDKFTISEARWPHKQASCIFCNCQLTMYFKDGQWVYLNATIASIRSQEHIMHKKCQAALELSYKEKSQKL